MSQTISVKVGREIDSKSSDVAHFLGMTKRDFYENAALAYIELNREKLDAAMQESLRRLNGSHQARVAFLTGLSQQEIDELGGLPEETP